MEVPRRKAAFAFEGIAIYVKLFGSILKSSVWDETAPTRLAWITLLLLADEDGFVQGVERGVARTANISLDEFRAALDVLTAPDLESQSQEYGGRRIEKVEGGWMVLNYAKYRELRTREQVKAAGRQRRKRLREKAIAPVDDDEQRDGRDSSRSSVSASASVSASEAVTENENVAFLDAASQAAYDHYAAFHGDLAGLNDAMRSTVTLHGVRAVGEALRDMRAAGARFTVRTLRGFAKKVADSTPKPRSSVPSSPPTLPWCSSCGDGVLGEVAGSKRLVHRHADDCDRPAAWLAREFPLPKEEG